MLITKKNIVTLYILISSLLSYGAAVNDSIYVTNLLAKAKTFYTTHPQKTIDLGIEAKTIALKTGYFKGYLNANIVIGNSYFYRNLHQESKNYYLENIDFEVSKNNPKYNEVIGITHTCLAFSYSYLNDYTSALHHGFKALNYLKNNADQSIKINQRIAVIYTSLKQFEKALNHYNKAKSIADSNKSKLENPNRVFTELYICLGDALTSQNKLDLALKHYKKAGVYAEKLNNNYNKIWLNNRLANYYLKIEKLKLAENHAKSALNLCEYTAAAGHKNEALTLLGNVYFNTGRISLSKTIFHNILDSATNKQKTYYKKKALAFLSKIYNKEGNHKKAFKFKNQLTELKNFESIFNSKKTSGSLAILNEQNYKNTELASQKKVILKQQNKLKKKQQQASILYISLFVLIVFSIQLLISIKNHKTLNSKKLNTLLVEKKTIKLNAVIESEENERKRLAQNLNYVINSNINNLTFKLAAITGKKLSPALKTKLNDIVFQLKKTSNEIQNISKNLENDTNFEYDLKDLLKKYCDKTNSFTDTKIIFNNFTLNLKTNQEQKVELYRIVQELLKNIITHAKASTAIVKLANTNTHIYLSVKDNGIGFNTKAITKGIGMQSIQNRLTKINGNLNVESNKKGTTVSITVKHN